jgi:hypothetical protein
VAAAADSDDAPRRRLDLRLGIPDPGDPPDVYPVVQILIDGEEILTDANPERRYNYIGSPPEALLGPDEPLVAYEPGRRVVLYVDACGVPTAGALAPVITGHDDVVVWSDFREFVDIDEAPVIGRLPEHAQSWPVAFPDLVFDAAQYLTEVRRASADWEAESNPWRTARLLDEYLSEDPWSLGGMRELGWVEPGAEGTGTFLVTVFDQDLQRSAVIRMAPGPGTMQEQAREMARELMARPTGQWPAFQPVRYDPTPNRRIARPEGLRGRSGGTSSG